MLNNSSRNRIKNGALLPLLAILLFAQCKKDTVVPQPAPVPATKDYAPLSNGDTFTYNDTTNSVASVYTFTTTQTTQVYNGKTYNRLSGSNGTELFQLKSGASYYRLVAYPSMRSGTVEEYYLNDSLPVNGSWTSNFKILNVLGFPDSLFAVATYKIAEKGGTLTVGGVQYKDVIHVSLTNVSAYNDSMQTSAILAGLATGDFYYAKGVGLVRSHFEIVDVPSYGISGYESTVTIKSYQVK